MARRSELSTLDWVHLRDFELLSLGADPADRIRFTGHTRCLPEPYLATIGTWGAYEVQELVNDAEPHQAVVSVSEAAFRRFKARHRLLGRSQFERRHGPYAWARAEVCFTAHERVQQDFDYHGARGPIGIAAEHAIMKSWFSPRGRSIGLMPVEVVLWTRVFDAMLAYQGFTVTEWLELDVDDKTRVWEMGDADGVWSVERFLHGNAVRGLHHLARAAA